MSISDPEVMNRIKLEANLCNTPLSGSESGEKQKELWNQLTPLQYKQFELHWGQVEHALLMTDSKRTNF